MDFEQEKTTALYPPVGADGGQPLSKETNQSIAEDTAEYKTQADDLEEIMQQIRRASDPAYLPTVSMNDLYEQVFPGRPPVIDGLLYAGTYLFVGAPKVGKSFLMAQLAYHVSMGIPLWGYAVNRGTVLYWLWRTITAACKTGFTGCSERTAPKISILRSMQSS